MRWRAQPDVEMGTESMRSGTKRPVRRGRIVQTRSTWKHVWILLVCAADVTLMKFGRQLPESDQNPHKCKSAKCSSGRRYKRSSMETVISTRMPHEAKRNSMVSKCRTRQPESCGTLSASRSRLARERCVDRTSNRSQTE